MTGAANRRRGADAERAVVNYLRANGYPDARRTLAGDGLQPGDIDFAPGIHLEVKDVASSAWPSWRAQAVAECRGRIPIVVRRTRGVPDVGRWAAQIPWASAFGFGLDPLLDLPAVPCLRTDLLWLTTSFADVIAALQSDTERTA